MSDKVVKLIEDVKALTVLELSELVKALEEEFGVSAAAPVAVAAAPAAGAGAAAEEKTEFDVVLKSDMKELQNTVGLRFDFKKFDVSYWGVYAPTLWNRFSPGITLINHLSFYYDEYLEFDFLVGPHIAYKPFKWFDFFFDFMYQFKSTTIYAIADKVPSVISNCPAFNLTFNFHIIPELSIDLTFSSYNFFKYYLFFSPNMTLGLKYSANEHYDARLFAEIQYVDMFTLSANLNRFTTGASVCWRF